MAAPDVPSSGDVTSSPTILEMSTEAQETAPTASHAIAVADHEEKGAAQEDNDAIEVKDLGWHSDLQELPAPLIGGLPNGELWTLIRRFNKQTYHVKAISEAPGGNLDLNIAEEEEFSPDKLRANLERLYMTVCYFIAWAFDFLVPTFLTMIVVLIVHPPSRPFLFPPAPLALVNASTGGLKKPQAGMLGTHDSLTGAPEKHEGEAVEQEASNFVSGLASIGLSSAVGKHPQTTPQDEASAIDTSVPDPTAMATSGSAAQDAAAGGKPSTEHDKTKQPMEAAMWGKARPVMHILANIADEWERFANALSPTPPFPKQSARLKLAGILVPVLAVAFLVTSYLFMKLTTFLTGGVFFGQPLLIRGITLLNEKVPDWQQYLEIKNSILKGVPTNAQLAITLLRIGEANKAPLPPPPRSELPPSDTPPALHGDDVPLDVSHEEVQDAIHPDASSTSGSTSGASSTKGDPPKHRHGRKMLSLLRGSARTGVSTLLGADRFKASAGSEHARNRLGVISKPSDQDITGPIEFKARYHGKKGLLFIQTNAITPSLSFTLDSSVTGKDWTRPPTPDFSVPIAAIRELKKVGGLGWKAKIVVGWAMKREVADGIQIVDGKGASYTFTAIRLREELFNRLIAMGGQKWESW
ncbi:MAG: hypothetical protein M1837_006649 [Sclerophora amabilis]|nr:MAG: hypothetical protein M1837_006649 [Sclerophora amabilis]